MLNLVGCLNLKKASPKKSSRLRPLAPASDPDPNRGLSVSFLVERLCRDLRITPDLTVNEIEPNIREKSRKTRCPRDGKLGAAYVNVAQDPDAGRANHMLSYTWGYTIAQIQSALSGFCEKGHLSNAEIVVWICCFCINQVRVKQKQASHEKVTFEEFHATFRNRVMQIGHVLSMLAPWDDPLNLKRLWCVFELHTSLQYEEECTLHILLPESEWTAFGKSLMSDSAGTISCLAKVSAALTNAVKVEEAEASHSEDREHILKIIAPDVDQTDQAAVAKACVDTNRIVTQRLQRWFTDAALDHAQKHGDGNAGVAFQLRVGWMLVNQKLYDDALALFDNAKSSARAGTDDMAQIMFQEAQCYRKKKDYQHAMKCYLHARLLFDESGSIVFVSSCNLQGLGITLYEMGEYDEALRVYGNMRDVWDSCVDSEQIDYGDVANGYKHMGNAHYMRGDLQEALRNYDLARETFINHDLETNTWFLDVLTCLGKVSIKLQRFEDARKWLELVGSRFRRLSDSTSTQYEAYTAAKGQLEFALVYDDIRRTYEDDPKSILDKEPVQPIRNHRIFRRSHSSFSDFSSASGSQTIQYMNEMIEKAKCAAEAFSPLSPSTSNRQLMKRISSKSQIPEEEPHIEGRFKLSL